MIDPVTALAAATAAFTTIKKGFEVGRDVESMAGDLSRWMGAVSAVANIEKRAKNPSVFAKVFYKDSIESEALEAFAAKKKLQQQSEELKTYIMFTNGTAAWDELLAMEGQIRKRRQKEIYEAQERKEKIIFWIIAISTIGIGTAILLAFAYGLWLLDRS